MNTPSRFRTSSSIASLLPWMLSLAIRLLARILNMPEPLVHGAGAFVFAQVVGGRNQHGQGAAAGPLAAAVPRLVAVTAPVNVSRPSFRATRKHRTTMCNCTSEVWSFDRPGMTRPFDCDVALPLARMRSIAQRYRKFLEMRVATAKVSGTEGYADEAEELFRRYESIPAAEAHRAVLHLFPTAPARVLDIGSGTGRDAAWFASQGHRVVAVEPTDAMRIPAMALHPQPAIEWLDDSLPELELVLARGETFDLVMLSAVWMHLDEAQRRRAMPVVAALVRPGDTVIMKIRNGPVPAGRRMFQVTPEETIELAQAQGLQPVLNVRTELSQESNRLAGVSWANLAFVKGKDRL